MSKIYLTARALQDLSDIAQRHNDALGNNETAFVNQTELMLMDEGAYALDYQDVTVTLAFGPDKPGADITDDEYVIILEVS